MKKYTHDYRKVSEAESHLYAAQQLNAHDDPIEAWKHVGDARRLLQEYISQDNMVEDNDVADGWVRASDVNSSAYRQTADPATTAAGKKVEKHGQIDGQYLKQNLEGADPTNPFYGKVVVESGTYEQIGMSRDEVAAAIQKLGAKINRKVSNTIDIFVQGNKPGPSKIKEVEELRAGGRNVRIISQIELKEILGQYHVITE